MTFPCLASKVFGTDTGKFRRQKALVVLKSQHFPQGKSLKNSFQKDSILCSIIKYQGLEKCTPLKYLFTLKWDS